MKLPELLAPAGNLEKLKVAVLYGADAVYLSGGSYGLRAFAGNFSNSELELAVTFAHARKAKVYVTLNSFLHDDDFKNLPEFCKFLDSIDVDAVIVSDLGVASIVKKHSALQIHLSTQASCLNAQAAKVWKDLGVSRIVLGRETSIEEAAHISKTAGIEVETFVHGAMCMSYSGNCTISNFTAGRDSNRGGCIQSCRFEYTQEQASRDNPLNIIASHNSHYMSSKDLYGTNLIPAFLDKQISSLKIEGRMKSLLYIATITKAYRSALDAIANGLWTSELQHELDAEINSVPHRDYTNASLLTPASYDSIYLSNDAPSENSDYSMLGIILAQSEQGQIVQLYKELRLGDEIEIITHKGKTIHYRVECLKNGALEDVESVRQNSVAILPRITGTAELNVIRAKNFYSTLQEAPLQEARLQC